MKAHGCVGRWNGRREFVLIFDEIVVMDPDEAD